MRDPHESFRVLDGLGEPPDVRGRATGTLRFVNDGGLGSPVRRAVTAAVALSIAAAAIGLAVTGLGTGTRVGTLAITAGRVAFLEERDGRTDLVIAWPDASGRIQVTDDDLIEGSVAWSADGSQLAFTVYDVESWTESLVVVDADGSDRRILCRGCTATFSVQRERTCGIDSCSDPGAWARPNMIAARPGGGWAAVPANGTTVSFVDIDGAVSELTLPGLALRGLSWSPDGDALAVSVDGEGRDAGLWVLDLSSREHERVVAKEPYAAPAWSPDGATIAYPASTRAPGGTMAELLFVDVRTRETRKVLGTDQLFEVYDVGWSADGERLAVLHHPVRPPTAALLTVDGRGTDVQMIALCESGGDTDGLCTSNGGEVAWSPDGMRLAFQNNDGDRRGVVTVDVRTGTRAWLTAGDAYPGCCFDWQPRTMPETTSSPTPNDEPSPVAVTGVVEHLGPVTVGRPNQTTAVAAFRDALWVAYYDDDGGHLARIDSETLAVVATIDDVPTPRWETGGGGMAIGGDGTVWIGGDDRLVAIRDDSIVVDRHIDGCCADVSAGALGLYVLLDTTTDLARPQGVVHLVDPDGSIKGDGTIVTGLVPRRLAQTASGYLGIIGWTTSDDGGITGAKVIPLHFEDVPPTIDGPTSDSGITVTSTGWTVAADGELTRLDIANRLRPVDHVDVPIARIAAIVETRQGVWVLGRERAVLVGADTGNVRFDVPLPDGDVIDPSCGTAASGITVYLLSCDGSVSGLAFGG